MITIFPECNLLYFKEAQAGWGGHGGRNAVNFKRFINVTAKGLLVLAHAYPFVFKMFACLRLMNTEQSQKFLLSLFFFSLRSQQFHYLRRNGEMAARESKGKVSDRAVVVWQATRRSKWQRTRSLQSPVPSPFFLGTPRTEQIFMAKTFS